MNEEQLDALAQRMVDGDSDIVNPPGLLNAISLGTRFRVQHSQDGKTWTLTFATDDRSIALGCLRSWTAPEYVRVLRRIADDVWTVEARREP